MWQYSGDVAFVESAESVYCLSLIDPQGRVVLLEGSGAEIWRALPERSTEDVIARMESIVGTDVHGLQNAVSVFVEHLHALGFIVEV
ncbi:PqqD family peptide modification chaperone [Rathayibacter sp. VKM Ac-2804]|uniref:PqqD family protein n=1 Tax=Rathayibacter sp. VKM Ac-2804 TaxID=2609257 RepID=UPI00132EB6EA|nr:PqqD family protein [Rathayibacter sp. VKM Ac-2804]QHF23916.1 PqqD family peptide modification chaperone [Rathayibacter sp. VKM Ac-2804]